MALVPQLVESFAAKTFAVEVVAVETIVAVHQAEQLAEVIKFQQDNSGYNTYKSNDF